MRNRDEAKERGIREKAIAMVAHEGFEGFGVNKLAQAAGVSVGTIYIYYKDKEDLLLRLCLEVSDHILQTSLAGLRPDMTFAEGLKRQWKNRYEFYKKKPLEVQFVEQVRYSPLYDKVTETLTENHGKVLGEFIRGAIKRKELVKLPYEIYWSLAFAPLYQLIKFHSQNTKNKFDISQAQFDQMLAIVIKGLKP